jgi:hypothetical protein
MSDSRIQARMAGRSGSANTGGAMAAGSNELLIRRAELSCGLCHQRPIKVALLDLQVRQEPASFRQVSALLRSYARLSGLLAPHKADTAVQAPNIRSE